MNSLCINGVDIYVHSTCVFGEVYQPMILRILVCNQIVKEKTALDLRLSNIRFLMWLTSSENFSPLYKTIEV